MREIANKTIATKNTIFAASMATPAIPPKPSNAAMSATMRNVTAQPNIVVTSVVGYGTAAAWQGNVNKGAMVPLGHVGPEAGDNHSLSLQELLQQRAGSFYMSDIGTSGLARSFWQH
jgi:hypothetical protein